MKPPSLSEVKQPPLGEDSETNSFGISVSLQAPEGGRVISDEEARRKAVVAANLYVEALRAGDDPVRALSVFAAEIGRFGLPKSDIKSYRNWFAQAFLRDSRQQVELTHFESRSIGKFGMPIVSDSVLESRRVQRAKQAKYVNQQELFCNGVDGEEVVPFSDVWNSPLKRAAKLYVRTLGIQKFCAELGLKGLFLTLTLPPAYHPNPANGSNAWQGLTPKDGHDELQSRWRDLQRRYGKTIGIRVEEQHKDGTPHWHVLLWVEPERIHQFCEQVEYHFGLPPQTKIEPIDPSRGTAATYLMKYVLKATGPLNASQSQEGTNDTAARADAHRATWGGRALAIFDIRGSASIWDELRRIKKGSSAHAQLSDDEVVLHEAALENDYCLFLQLLHSIRSKGRQCQLVYKVAASGKKGGVEGVTFEGKTIRTHVKVWSFRKISSKRPSF